MRKLSGKIPSYSLFGFDTETTGNNQDFLMGSIVNENDKIAFWDQEEMINAFIENPIFRRSSRIFATNLYFDITALFRNSDYMDDFQFIFRGTHMIQAKLPIKDRCLIFLDTSNFYPYSVKKMGEILKLPKLKEPEFIGKRMPKEDEKSYIEQYNIRDSEITFKFAEFLQKSFNNMGCKMRITAASTAMDLFKRHYMINDMFQEPIETINTLYQAYYGARSEVFKRGLIKNVNYYDFNSLYPSVMRNEYPDVSSSKTRTIGTKAIIDHYDGISDVVVKCPDDINIPFLPSRFGKKLIFPTGIFKGYYSNVELRYAEKIGYEILEVGKQIYYTKSHFPFKRYVEELYAIRKEKKANNDSTELIIKMLMNSLYGKFGQKIYGRQKIINISKLSFEEINKLSENAKTMISKNFMYIDDMNPSYIPSHIMPIYALYTTAYGKIKLYETIKTLSDVIYCDTDSIVTSDILKDSKELGEVKLEHRIKEGIFLRPKMYAFKTNADESIVRIKGNSISSKWNYDRFKEFILNPKINIQQFSTFKTSNRLNIPYNSILNLSKEFSLNDDKRIWDSELNMTIMQDSIPIKVKL